MLASKYISCPWLKEIHRSDFVIFSEWILGEEVYTRKVSTAQGERHVKATWHILMNFEYKARQRAFKKVNEDGEAMHDALKKIPKDPGLMPNLVASRAIVELKVTPQS